MNYLTLAWYWLVFSSNNAQNISLTLKGVLVAALTYATMLAGLANIQLPSETLTQLTDNLVLLVPLLMAISYAVTIVCLARKVFKTFAGTNRSCNRLQTAYTPLRPVQGLF
jgi:hypothetical protein